METTWIHGIECVRISNGRICVTATRSCGPRILQLNLTGGENLFADLPQDSTEIPGRGVFRLYGGHRLWHSPEVFPRTYLPDNDPVEITEVPDGLQIIQPQEPETGIVKSISIYLPPGKDQVIVDHYLENRSIWPVELAAWAITMLKIGGTAVMPIASDLADPDGLQPNRLLVLWPYTNLSHPCLKLGKQSLRLTAKIPEGAIKLGTANPEGWLAYLNQDTLFIKRSTFIKGESYLDIGCSHEIYANRDFIELETLSPRTLLAPGNRLVHRETWEVYPNTLLLDEEEAMLAEIRTRLF